MTPTQQHHSPDPAEWIHHLRPLLRAGDNERWEGLARIPYTYNAECVL